MGMRGHPCCGYVVPISALYDAVPGLEEVIDEGVLNNDDIQNWLGERWSEDWPNIVSVFQLNEEDTPSEGMEIGELYVLLDDEQMYELKPTDKLKRLQAAGVSPEHQTWSIWG